MLAWMVEGYERAGAMRMRRIASPQPAAEQVCLRVEAAGVSFADGLSVAGRHQLRREPPFVPGSEVAGSIESLGPGVRGLRIGDRVCAVALQGAFAERACAAAAFVVPVPDGVALDAAACMRVGHATALYALVQRGGLQPDETVLVLGAGGAVGNAAVQIAKLLGARVIGAASTPQRRRLATESGADAVIDSQADGLRAALRPLVGDGRGLQVVVDPVGGQASEAAFRSLGKGGRHLVIGFASGHIPQLALNLPLLKSASLIGVDIGHFERHDPAAAQANMTRLFDWTLRGAMRVPMDRRFPLAEADLAIERVMKGEACGRVVLDMNMNLHRGG